MKLLRDWPIRRKMTAVVFLTSGLVVIVACAAMFLFQLESFRQQVTKNLTTLARIVAANSSAAVVFQDEAAATETLSALKATPHVVSAVIYGENNRVFAYYRSHGAPSIARPAFTEDVGFEDRNLVAAQPITLDGKTLGYLYLRADFADLQGRLVRFYSGVLALVLGVSLVLAIVLSGYFQALLTKPILRLAGTARAIAVNKDYSLRAEKPGEDEVGVLTDAFNTMLAEIETRDRGRRLAAAFFDNTSESIIVTDAHKRIITVNAAYTRMSGFGKPEVVGTALDDVLGPDAVPAHNRAIWEQIERVGHWAGETRYRSKDGKLLPLWKRINAVRDGAGRIVNYVANCSDISLFKAQQARLEYLASYDDLTGLPNRTLFHDRIRHVLDKAKRGQGRGAISFVDLDNFKVVNDTLGHPAGDQLLQIVTERLKRAVREGDTVSRFGGDEFGILLEDIGGPGQIAATMHRIASELGRPCHIDGHEIFVTASIGISLFPDDGEDVQALVKNADTAMYKAKDAGKNGYQFFTSIMNVEVFERLRTETHLRRGLEREEFSLVYQPVVSLPLGRLVGAEALLRWHSPDLGLVPNERFIGIAEQTGLIAPIGAWVLSRACRQAKAWIDTGAPIMRVAVNVSAQQFRSQDLPRVIRSTLDETGLCPEALEIELTESTLMQDPEGAAQTLRDISSLGVSISIDDFGTGYSSLAYLQRFNIDKLKIDRSFVRDIAQNADAAAIVSAIIALAHTLRMSVVAEGVETAEQLVYLRRQQCDAAQGYLFNRPVPADEILSSNAQLYAEP
ncbi:MAG: bifunctional diguanylate cyclase/phosphodiesterase [Gammaproteobacteria bacterium]